MRFVIFRKADRDTEAGVMPTGQELQDLLDAMGRYNQELAAHGHLVDGMGLRPSADGARVVFAGGKPAVTDGPFAETKELVAGFTVIEAASLDEAVALARRWPPMDGGGNVELEVRRVYGLDDFAPGEGLERHRDLERRMARRPSLLNPNVVFDGRCREAFAAYADILGGDIELMVTRGEAPDAQDVPADERDLILHARLRVGPWVLMGADLTGECYGKPSGFGVHIAIDDPDRAQEAFDRLADGGEIQMPFAETFWAHRFGMLTDRWGIPWMINCARQDG